MRPPALTHPSAAVFLGDCLDVLAEIPDNSIDAIVTDPPYGLEFMGKEWDSFKTGRAANYAQGGQITETEFKNLGALPSYVRRPAKRCGNCGKQAWSGSPCTCPEPRWIMDNSPLHAFQAFNEAWCREAFRVLKPGGHLLAFGGTRTWHRLAVAVEDAGFEVRDSIAWLYGSGFPKSLDVSKAIDKGSGKNRERQLQFTAWMRSTGITRAEIDAATGTSMGSHYLTDLTQPAIATADLFDRLRPLLPEVPEEIERLVAERTGIAWTDYVNRPVVGQGFRVYNGDSAVPYTPVNLEGHYDITAPATDAAAQWQGWGTALKPAFEPIVVARKPLVGTVAANVLAHGTGALNINATRVGASWEPVVTRCASCAAPAAPSARPETPETRGSTATRPAEPTSSERAETPLGGTSREATGCSPGPTPTGVAGSSSSTGPSGSDTTDPSPTTTLSTTSTRTSRTTGSRTCTSCCGPITPDTTTSASSGRWPSNILLDGSQAEALDEQADASRFFPTFRYQAKAPTRERPTVVAEDGTKTAHPTVKPLALMRWLVRLVTPPGGTVLDTFAGSGATVEAAIEEGFYALGIEREESYLPLIQIRLDRVTGPEAAA